MSGEAVLVTGGAGYVGAHVCLALAEAGYRPVAVDDLSTGHEDLVRWGPLERVSLLDRPAVEAVLRRHAPAAIVHCAARAVVGDSVRDPEAYRLNNVAGSEALLQAASAAGVRRVIYSSTCAVYGLPLRTPMDEAHPCAPLTPYGETKLEVERMLAARQGADPHFRHVVLRYFNAAGADPRSRAGERHVPETHAVPLAIEAAFGGPVFRVFGDDYPTRDGTAERDYVHVADLAEAHVLALRRLFAGGGSAVLNLGSGRGTTVRELLDVVERVTGRPVRTAPAQRRAGDAPILLADAGRAAAELGWRARRGLDEIVADAVNWRSIEQTRPVPPADETAITADSATPRPKDHPQA